MFRFKIVRDTFVCREHELFDQTMGDVALRARDALHQSEFVEFDHWLRQVEVDRPAALALAVQDQSKIAHEFERWDKRCVTLARRRIAFDYRIDRSVSHALDRTDDSFAQFIANDFAAR